MKKVLFLTWDGPQVNYLESLFLPVFNSLRDKGYEFHIIQYTWGDSSKSELACDTLNFQYTRIGIQRKINPFGEFFTLIKSTSFLKKYIKNNSIDILMPRSIFPLIPTLLLIRKLDVKFVFDADGLMLDEKVEFGGWNKNTFIYKFLRIIEKKGLEKSSIVLTRTQQAKNILLKRANIEQAKIHIVSNGRDPNVFYPSNNNFRIELGISSTEKILIYVGSVGNQYSLQEMLSFYISFPMASRFIILTNEINLVKDKIKSYQFDKGHIIIVSVDSSEVPKYIQIADLGLSFRKPSLSMKAVSPIKLGEYLLCGIPVISTAGIGDTEEIIKKEGCGYILKEFSNQEYGNAYNWFINYKANPKELHKIGKKYFSLENTVNEYYHALQKL